MSTAHPAEPQTSTPQVVIAVRTSSGDGRTHLSAFDHALLAAGVGDYNLLSLSSVIPPGSVIRAWEPSVADGLSGTHGDRLYCVMAHAYADQPGAQAWAGLGWVLDPTTGAGLFVEHTATTEEELRRLLDTSLDDLVAHRGGGYPERHHAVSVATCVDRPVCALALASYMTSPWRADVD